MTKESQFDSVCRQIDDKEDEVKKITRQLETEIASKLMRLVTAANKIGGLGEKAKTLHEEILEKTVKELTQENQELKAKLAEFELQSEAEASEDPSLVKAKTIAIFDSILFAIENWSKDGDTAPDFSLACQSILFPLVYNQVMNGNEHYFLKTVPTASIEVVKRGREYVKFIRSTCQVGLTDPEAWSVHVPMIAKWWVNDALPLLYGARDDVWERSTPLTLEAIMSWRDQASKSSTRVSSCV